MGKPWNQTFGSLGITEGQLFVLAGPCVIENEDLVLEVASFMKDVTQRLGIPYVFKASYDKANRSSHESYRGPRIEKGLAILEKVKQELNLPIVSDVHTEEEIKMASSVLDVLQIPAYLCRQTDLLVAAGQSGCIVNIKKGQFLAPWDMKHVLAKVVSTGNDKVFLTERGASFGYNNLVSDMRSIPIMKENGVPVVFDATHSVQLPGGSGSTSSGEGHFAPLLAYAACAVGCDGLFFETHPNPKEALSDGPNMVALKDMEDVLYRACEVKAAASRGLK